MTLACLAPSLRLEALLQLNVKLVILYHPVAFTSFDTSSKFLVKERWVSLDTNSYPAWRDLDVQFRELFSRL